MLGEEGEESSECSSGCQSGWTMYLDQSYEKGGSFQEDEEEEEEDLSMVSDASSGPPQFHEQEEQYYCFCSSTPSNAAAAAALASRNAGKKRRVESEKHKDVSSLLDDTASSSFLSYSESINTNTTTMRETMGNVVEFSCASSATHYKEKSALQKQMGYLQSFNPRKQTVATPVCREEGKRCDNFHFFTQDK